MFAMIQMLSPIERKNEQYERQLQFDAADHPSLCWTQHLHDRASVRGLDPRGSYRVGLETLLGLFLFGLSRSRLGR